MHIHMHIYMYMYFFHYLFIRLTTYGLLSKIILTDPWKNNNKRSCFIYIVDKPEEKID